MEYKYYKNINVVIYGMDSSASAFFLRILWNTGVKKNFLSVILV